MLAQQQRSALTRDIPEVHSLASCDSLSTSAAAVEAVPRVALLTPYTGGNFGDAAIQDAMIANLRLRLPRAQFSGISLNTENYLQRHGVSAFPLCASGGSFYGMAASVAAAAQETARRKGFVHYLKAALRRLPGAPRLIKSVKPRFTTLRDEFRHCVNGYRFVRGHNLVVVCGGGQLDEEWGGPWGHPFALFKWALLSKLARVPYAIASVGACKTNSRLSRFFLSAALRMARYRSYRDANSRAIAAGFFSNAANDSVVPDLAFSLTAEGLPPAVDLRNLAQGHTIVAISPIVYAKPGSWPSADANLHSRYLNEMAEVVSQLLKRNAFLVFVWSARGDEPVISELLSRLDEDCRNLLARQSHIPALNSWKDLLAILQGCDFLIASRLHSTIFGFLARLPLIAISFDPKVDWAMRDLGQSDCLLQIRSFTASDVVAALGALDPRRPQVVQQLATYRQTVSQVSVIQFDALAKMAFSASTPSN